MKRLVMLVAAAFVLAGLAAPAQAVPITFHLGGINVTHTSSLPLIIEPFTPFDFTLDGVGDTTSRFLFNIKANNFAQDASGTISVEFSFTPPPQFGSAIVDTGTISGDANCFFQADQLWLRFAADPITATFGSDGTGRLSINLPNEVWFTNVGRLGTGLGAYIPATFTLAAEPVFEPGSILLLGTGLIGLAGAVRRRMKK